MPSTRVCKNLALAPAAGSGTTNYDLNPQDYSNCEALRAVLTVTAANTNDGASDTYDVYLQARDANGVWEDRAHFTQVTGAMTPSANAPLVYELDIQQFGALTTTEQASPESGSAGASRLAAATVKNGVFPGKYRTAATGWTNSWRVQVVQVDADSDAAFAATVDIYGSWSCP
jgi:hypothetical protein